MVLLVLKSLTFTAPVAADDDDYDIRRTVEAGEIVPLEILLVKIRQEFGGRILKVELEREDYADNPGWVYEAKVLTPDGRVLKLEYDASTLQLLKLKGRHKHYHKDDDD